MLNNFTVWEKSEFMEHKFAVLRVPLGDVVPLGRWSCPCMCCTAGLHWHQDCFAPKPTAHASLDVWLAILVQKLVSESTAHLMLNSSLVEEPPSAEG